MSPHPQEPLPLERKRLPGLQAVAQNPADRAERAPLNAWPPLISTG